MNETSSLTSHRRQMIFVIYFFLLMIEIFVYPGVTFYIQGAISMHVENSWVCDQFVSPGQNTSCLPPSVLPSQVPFLFRWSTFLSIEAGLVLITACLHRRMVSKKREWIEGNSK